MYTRNIKLPTGKTITFETPDDNELGKQMIECFNKSVPFFPKTNADMESSLFWQSVLENDIGNRNCTYILNNIFDNIVTPIEVNILESRGYPTDIRSIIKYMCEEIVKGRIDSWNDTDNLRVRTSEIFVALLQKQIYAAYTEYVSKKIASDPDAKLYVNSTAVLSTIINSQSVQQFENINPQEELSMMTRITPIGIGGVPSGAAWPQNAMNTHYTYYGNIDAHETPNSDKMGILQHLTIGSAITNTRGLFASRDRNSIKPHEILSVGPALIPFVESNDGARVTMASGQAKQAIPLKNKEIPAIQTGFESTLPNVLSDFFIKRSPIDGEIVGVSDLEILIRDNKTNKISTMDIKPVLLKSGEGKNGLGVFYPTVKVGTKVKPGDIIAEGSGIKNGIMSSGLNMLVAFMAWKGYNFEDGMVISASAAKKFTSLHLEEKSVYLGEDEDVAFIAGIGDYVKKGDILLTHSTTLYDTETLKHVRAEGGKIVNIEIYSNFKEELIPEVLIPTFKEFRERYIRLHGKYPIGTFKERGKPFIGILIKFNIQQELVLVKGDKLNNRHFNKGIVAIIEPDENMPQLPDGRRVEMIYSTLSVINRMNSGQLMEIHTSMISKELYNIAINKSREEFIVKYANTLDLLDGTEGKHYSKTSITRLKSMSEVTYRELIRQIKEDGFVPLIFPPFKSPPRENIIKALKLLGLSTTYKLKLPEYNKTTETGVAVGYMYVNKLEHQSEKKLSSRATGPYVSGTLAPTAGKKKSGGRKIGEGDLYSLLAWDVPTLIDEFYGGLSTDHISKHNLISEIIQKGEANFKPSSSNPVREIFSAYMLAIMLSAN